MPPKFNPNDPAVVELLNLFKSFGLSEIKSLEVARNAKTTAALKDLVVTNNLTNNPLDEKQASLVASLAAQGAKLGESERNFATQAVATGKLRSPEQLTAAIKYLEAHSLPVNENDFNTECGVGYSITPEVLYEKLVAFVGAQPSPSWATISPILNLVRQDQGLRWANTLDVKNTLERIFTERFGPKPAAAPKSKAKDTKKDVPSPEDDQPAEGTSSTEVDQRIVFEEGFLGKLHKVGENPQKHAHRRAEHLAWTGGKVFTRFPPEPNGFLHIGHSKAIFVDFGYAAHNGGHTYLRYDDTNPEAEEGRYFESILETVRWLGFEPYKITYSSDHFQKLYELAVELTKRDLAYVCHCTGEEIHEARGGEDRKSRKACVHRTRPVEESLEEFEKMRNGTYKPGEAILRMKQDLEDGNPQMWDLVAYRVLDAVHHRTGDKWRIYPTYDFTHCLCDSFENITHSLCTTEFIQSRVSYEWLCDALDLYKPRQSEFGRLSLEGTITSKRKLKKLVEGGHVMDWDDPRLYTLIALRRRGVPPGAILSFVGSLGVSTAPSNIQITRFEQSVRQYLENTVPRLLMVLNPLKVTLENVAEDEVLLIEKALHPKVPELGTSQMPFTRTLYIEADDFRLQDSKDYFRLAPGKTVGLFQAPHPITYISHKTDETGKVTEVVCRLEDGKSGVKPPKPKAFLQWVAEHAPSGSPVKIDETRIFHRLFKSDAPASQKNFLEDIAPNTLDIIKTAIIEVGFWPLAKRAHEEARRIGEERTKQALAKDKDVKDAVVAEEISHDDTPKATADQLVGHEVVRFQGLRVAYFALDKDSKLACLKESSEIKPVRHEGDRVVLNRIVSLKEDSSKASV